MAAFTGKNKDHYFQTDRTSVQNVKYAMTCCAVCIRLLVGRGMNICHEV